MMLAAPQDNYLASRNEALHNVESAIRDIGGIFQQLAHMVGNTSAVVQQLQMQTVQLHYVHARFVTHCTWGCAG